MSAEYRVTLEQVEPDGSKLRTWRYVKAPDTDKGYKIARRKALKLIAKCPEWHNVKAVETFCVG